MFYCIAAMTLHETLDLPAIIHSWLALLAQLLLPASIALWTLADARRRGQSLHFDSGSFIYFAWPVLVPLYLFSTRGWRAFAALGRFLVLYIAAAFFGSIPYIILSLRH